MHCVMLPVVLPTIVVLFLFGKSTGTTTGNNGCDKTLNSQRKQEQLLVLF